MFLLAPSCFLAIGLQLLSCVAAGAGHNVCAIFKIAIDFGLDLEFFMEDVHTVRCGLRYAQYMMLILSRPLAMCADGVALWDQAVPTGVLDR